MLCRNLNRHEAACCFELYVQNARSEIGIVTTESRIRQQATERTPSPFRVEHVAMLNFTNVERNRLLSYDHKEETRRLSTSGREFGMTTLPEAVLACK